MHGSGLTMPPPEENFEWWERGACDGIEAVALCAGLALSLVGETFDDGEHERARMLVHIFQGYLTVDRIRRREDGRIDATDLFINRDYIEGIRRRTRESGDTEPESDQHERSDGTGQKR